MASENPEQLQPQDEPAPSPRPLRELWQHPITVVAFVILIMTIALITANVLGIDRGGTLESLSRTDFARGLITYLFAVGTIGVIVAVILSILLSEESSAEKAQRAKDILTILIGIFGTIVGYYFGTQFGESQSQAAPLPITIVAPLVPDEFVADRPLDITTIVSGGVPPYDYWILSDAQAIQGSTEDLIQEQLAITPTAESLTVVIFVKDQTGNSGMEQRTIALSQAE